MRASIKQSDKNLRIPLKSLKIVSRYPKENKVIIEINLASLEKENEPKTLDELINQAKVDFALGNFQTFTSTHDLIADLQS